jgi:acetyl-CoA acyltransferase
MNEAFIVDVVRSPIGRKNGTLSGTRADDLAAHALRKVVERNGVDAGAVEDVILGCVTQIGEQGWNIARMAVLAAGFPVEVCGTSVNRMCGSSLQTTNFAAQGLMSGQADLVISAGVEVMSRTLMGTDGGDLSSAVTDRYPIVPQGFSAEMIAEQWGLSREELDEYSYNSHQRALAAQAAGKFDREIEGLEVTVPEHVREKLAARMAAEGGGTAVAEAPTRVMFERDETPRDSPLEKVASLQPAFKPDGVITAGNASQICDGSAALLMASSAALERHGLTPRARIVSTGLHGVDPTIMLTGNPGAINKAIERAGLTLADMAVIEINEAFACVPLQTVKDLGLEDRMDDVNPNGGGISLGHPLGASGGRILATMLGELERRDARYGVASMCIGFGQAVATVVERV